MDMYPGVFSFTGRCASAGGTLIFFGHCEVGI
jgi:hypothetical protein